MAAQDKLPPQLECSPAPSTESPASPLFEVLGELGRGGMATVYRVRDRLTNELLALKVCESTEPAADRRERIKREFRLGQQVQHPRIPRPIERGVWRGQPWFTMAPIEGRSLRELSRSGSGLSEQEVIDLAIQACELLEAVHEAGVLHRDVKTSNFVVSPLGALHLVDFGIAEDLGHAEHRDLGLEGSPLYAPPERFRGGKEDVRSDVFGLGVTIFEMLTGEMPIVGRTLPLICARVLSQTPEQVRSLQPSVSAELAALVARMMAKSPQSRPASASQVRAELLAIREFQELTQARQVA